MQQEPAFDGAMAEGTAASATDSGFFKSKFRDYVHSTLAEASGRYRGWSLGLASALSFPFRKCEVEPDAEPPLTEGVAQGNAQAESTCCEISAAAGAERVSGSAAPEVERERQDETPEGRAEGCAVELEALVGIEDKLLSLRGRVGAMGGTSTAAPFTKSLRLARGCAQALKHFPLDDPPLLRAQITALEERLAAIDVGVAEEEARLKAARKAEEATKIERAEAHQRNLRALLEQEREQESKRAAERNDWHAVLLAQKEEKERDDRTKKEEKHRRLLEEKERRAQHERDRKKLERLQAKEKAAEERQRRTRLQGGAETKDSGQAVQGQGSSELEDRRSGKDGDRDQRKVEPGENLIPEEAPWAVESWWEAPGVAWPLELNASPLGGALLPPISRSEATGAAFEEAFMVPPATASAPPATDPSPPCFGVSFGSALFPRPETAPHGSPTPGPAKRELHFAECDDPVVDDKVQVRPKQGLTPSSPPAKASPPAGPPGSLAAGELVVAVLSPKERARRCSLRALRKALDDATKPALPSQLPRPSTLPAVKTPGAMKTREGYSWKAGVALTGVRGWDNNERAGGDTRAVVKKSGTARPRR